MSRPLSGKDRRSVRPDLRRIGPARRRILSAVLFAAAGFLAAPQEVPYSVAIAPEPPTAGEDFRVTVLLPGASAREVRAAEPEASGDLSFVSLAVSAAVIDSPEGSRPGARVVYTFRPTRSGDLRIPRLEVSVAGSPLPLGPLALEVRPSGNVPPPALYAWRAPGAVIRWQTFSARLEPRAPSAPALGDYGLPATKGLSLEPAGGSAFVGIPLEEGDLFLPPATSREGGRVSEGARVRSLPAPRELEASRAVGDFTLRLARAGGGPIRAGQTLAVRAEIRGRGNLPILNPPEIRIRGPGGPRILPETSPISEIRITSGAYEGMTGRELRFSPEVPGDYIVESGLFTFLNPDTGELRTLRAPPLRVAVEPSPRESQPRTELRPRLDAPIAAYADSGSPWAAAASRARDGDIEAALRLLTEPAVPEAFHLKGILLMAEGDGAGALAALAAAERRNRWLPGLAETLELCEGAFGAGPRIRDRLPQPRIFGALSIVLGAAGVAILGLTRLRARTAGRTPGTIGWVLASAAGLSLLLCGASALERRVEYAVAATPDSFTVPSESGTPGGSYQGRAGIVGAVSEDWTLLRFPDGRSAWFRAGDIHRY